MKLQFSDPISGQPVAVLPSCRGTVTVGRASSCNVVIPSRYSSVSSLHASIRSSGVSAEIIDGDGARSSTNGLYINGEKQPVGVWLALQPGMSISLGRPGTSSSIALTIGADSAIPPSHDTKPPAHQPTARSAVDSAKMANASSSIYGQESINRISEPMRRRLEQIDKHLDNGYTLHKELRMFPVFIGSNGRKHPITIFSSPAGFSWVAFLFPFAVCTQIREWSYFIVASIVFAVVAVLDVATGFDPTIGASIAISLSYGIYYPYYRRMALARDVKEIPTGMSIILGIVLAVIASIPSLAIDVAAYYATN